MPRDEKHVTVGVNAPDKGDMGEPGSGHDTG